MRNRLKTVVSLEDMDWAIDSEKRFKDVLKSLNGRVSFWPLQMVQSPIIRSSGIEITGTWFSILHAE